MATGADLAWLRKEARLPLGDAARFLGVSGVELWAWEGRAKNVPDRLFERVRKVYYQNQRQAPAEPVEEYIAGLPEQETCTHHWIIERPAGSMSEGRCRGCGSVRTFQNSGDFHQPGPGD